MNVYIMIAFIFIDGTDDMIRSQVTGTIFSVINSNGQIKKRK